MPENLYPVAWHAAVRVEDGPERGDAGHDVADFRVSPASRRNGLQD